METTVEGKIYFPILALILKTTGQIHERTSNVIDSHGKTFRLLMQ